MRVAFLHELAGLQGGVEQNLVVSARALAARGHELVLIAEREGAQGADTLRACFQGTWIEPDLARPAGDAAFAEHLARLAPDVVYVHKLARLPVPLFAPGHPRTLRMVHDHDLTCPRRHRYLALGGAICPWPAGWRCWLDGAFLGRPGPLPGGFKLVDLRAHATELRRNRGLDRLLVGSRAMRDELVVNGLDAARVAILPPVLPDLPAPAPAPGPEPVVLFVGQLVRGKGVDLLLDALTTLPGDWRAEIVGEGNARPALEAQARRLGLAGRVRFLGWLDHEALDPVYARARLLVVPSRWAEPFGMVGLEAMQRGRAVVAFAVGGIPDWCEDGVTGLLAPAADTGALARAIGRLLDERELARRLGEAGRARAAERFSFGAYVDALEAHLAGDTPAGGGSA